MVELAGVGHPPRLPRYDRFGSARPPVHRALRQAPKFAAKARAFFRSTIPVSDLHGSRARLRQALDRIRRRVFSARPQRTLALYSGQRSDIHNFLASCRQAFWGLAVFSGLSNILMLTGSFFMLQVYDRVLPSRSVPTLIGLMILATVLYAFQGGLDLIRNRISARIGRFLEETLGLRVYDAVVRLPLKTRGDGDGLQPLRDIDQVRSFLSHGGPTALFDLPWIPLYLGICFYFHFWIGVVALAGACVLVGFTILMEIRTRDATKASAGFAVSRNALAVEGRRNAEVVRAMGMRQRLAERWYDANRNYVAANEAASDIASGLGSAVESVPHDLAVRRAGGRRLSGHPPGSDCGHHHRRFDPDVACARTGRGGDRQLEGLCRGAPGRTAA